MKKSLRTLLMLTALFLPLVSNAQVYVSDYSFTSSEGSFSSISSTGTAISSLATDDASYALTLPFTFPFGADSCSSVMIGSNGQIGIGTANPTNNGFEAHTSDMSIISVLGLDLDLTDAGNVYYEVQGYAPDRIVVIEYDHVHPYDDTVHYASFQVQLHENGYVDFVYDTINFASNTAAYIFMRENAHNRAISIVGSWSSLGTSGSILPLSLGGTNIPAPGCTLSFTRNENSCPRPLNFICTSFASPDSVAFTWNLDPDGIASQWRIAWDTVGTPVDSMLNYELLTDTFYTCTTMVAGGVYDVYLSTDCGTDMSFWEGPITVTPGAFNMPVTGTNIIYACGGFIYDDGGPDGQYSNSCNSTLVVYPSSPDSVVVITGTISSESCCDHLYFYDGASASGALLGQYEGNNVPISVRSTSGPITIRFTSDGSVIGNGFALSVNCVAAPSCRYINSVSVDNVAGSSALFSWQLTGSTSYPSHYVVTLYQDSIATPVREDTTSQLYYFFHGLDPVTHYSAHVCSICGEDTVAGDSVRFQTRCLSGGETNPSGSETTLTTSVPVNSGWGNTFCQSIYTAAELTAMGLHAGPIRGITYNWNTGGSYDKELVVFLGQTTNATFSSFAPLTGCMTQVYSGNRPTSHVGKTEYLFDNNFVWDGVSNIVLTSFVNQPSGSTHYSSGFYGYSSNAGATRTIWRYRDGTAFTTTSINSSGTTGTSTYRPNVTFIADCDSVVSCVAPNVIVNLLLADSVGIIWAPGYDETSWDLAYREESDTAWTEVATAVTDMSYVFDNLTPMRDYIFRVTPSCGGDSIFALATATTPCVPLVDLPFTENFEEFVATSTAGSPITPCWHRGCNYTYSQLCYVSTSYANSGSKSMYLCSYGSTYYSYLALPAMAPAIDSLMVSFATRGSSTSYSISVGVMTDPEDYATFQTVASITTANINTWEFHEVPLSNYAGEGKYIAFVATGNTYIYLDDIEVSYIPTCPRPTNTYMTSITTNGGTIHWTDTTATIFEIEYGPSGFAHGTGTIITSMDDSSSINGLNHSSRYDVYVRGYCGEGDTSNWSFVTSFTTECAAIEMLPYSQNFSGWGVGTSARPACWTCGGYSSYPYIMENTDAAGRISHVLNLYTYSANNVYASLPELDSISYPINLVQTVFRAYTNNVASTSYSHRLIVGVCTVPGDLSTFTAADTITLTDEPIIYEVAFNNITAGKYVTFVSAIESPAYYNYAYIDSVALELIPDCAAPNHLASSGCTSTSATIGWTPRGSSTTWEVEYGPYGFMRGTGTHLVTTTYPITLTSLTPSTRYQFFVRTICGDGDTSLYSLTSGTFTTRQNPASAPYFYDFEDGAEWSNWQTCSNTTINWYRDTAAGNGTNGFDATGLYAMYVSADTGRTYSTRLTEVVNASAYRDIDFGTVDTSYLLTFRAKAGGTTTTGYDGLMVFLVDPDIEVLPSSTGLQSPWGNVQNMTPLALVRVNTNWNTYSFVIDTTIGVRRLAFYWFNQATGLTNYVGGPAAVDDISITYVSCPKPIDVHATRLSATNADVAWHGPESAEYYVICRTSTGQVVSTDRVYTNSIQYVGLTPNTKYNVQVRRICSDEDSSGLSLAGSFSTLVCNDGIIDTIGDVTSTSTSYYLPVSTAYNYSYSQQIIHADEIGNSGEISAIHFYYYGTTATNSKTACSLYVAQTNRDHFVDNNDFVSPDSLTLVYTGAFNFSAGWNRIVLTDPFEYNGSGNLVIAVDDNSSRNQIYNCSYYVTPTGAIRSHTIHSASDIDASSLSGLQSSDGYHNLYGFHNTMNFEFCPPNPCSNPILRDPIIRPSGVTLRWRNTGTRYQLSYRRPTTSSWIVDNVDLTDTFYTITTALLPNTEYVYRVRQYCDTIGISNYTYSTFNPSNIPCLSPMDLHVTALTNNKVTLYWDPEENNLSYRLHVFNSYTDKNVNCYLAHGSVTGLDGNTVYYAAVQATCQDFDDPSAWSDTISFTTDVCPDVSNLTVSDVQGNSCVLDWEEGGRAEQWEIQYGGPDFSQGTGVSVIADHHPFTLTGLVGETTYDIYVRALCGTNFPSEHWSNRVSISTPYSSISSVVDDARVRLFPNPTSGDVELTLPVTTGTATVAVVDVAGRTVLTAMLPAGTERTTLATAQLGQGAYYVRITAPNINAVKKLIVR